MITDEIVKSLATRHHVPAEVICTTCGRPSYSSAHHGHTVTRVNSARGRRVPTTTAASRGRMPTPPAIEWLTVMDVARELGVSKMTVYRLCHSGELVNHRIGRSFRIKREAFDTYLTGVETSGA